jgi:hypothetical protein
LAKKFKYTVYGELLVDIEEIESEPRGVILGKAVVGSIMVVVVVGIIMLLAKNYREVGDRAARRALEAAERARVARVVIEEVLPEELELAFAKVEELEVMDVVSSDESRSDFVGQFSDGLAVVEVSGNLKGKELLIVASRVGQPPMAVKAGLLSQFRACMKKRKTNTPWIGRKIEWSAESVNMVSAPSGKGFAPGYLSKFEWVAGI